MYKFVGRKDKLYETPSDDIKENSNCPDSEKNGTGPGSCGGSSGKNKDTSGGPNVMRRKGDVLPDGKIKGSNPKPIDKKIQSDAIQDFADNMGEKPEDDEILQRGMDKADELGLTNDKAMEYATKYSVEYDKAWKLTVSDGKKHGFKK